MSEAEVICRIRYPTLKPVLHFRNKMKCVISPSLVGPLLGTELKMRSHNLIIVASFSPTSDCEIKTHPRFLFVLKWWKTFLKQTKYSLQLKLVAARMSCINVTIMVRSVSDHPFIIMVLWSYSPLTESYNYCGMYFLLCQCRWWSGRDSCCVVCWTKHIMGPLHLVWCTVVMRYECT